jgi:hypothetical protein
MNLRRTDRHAAAAALLLIGALLLGGLIDNF